MKKQIITLALILIGMTGLMAQNDLNKIVVMGVGDLTLIQGDTVVIKPNDSNSVFNSIKDGKFIAMGSEDFTITLPELNYLEMMGAGDVTNQGTLKGGNLKIMISGACDVNLDVDYDSIFVSMSGAGDVKLKGRCHYLNSYSSGVGDLDINELQADEKTLSSEAHYDFPTTTSAEMRQIMKEMRDDRREERHHRSLLYDAQWGGFDAGLNMLFSPSDMDLYTGADDMMTLKPFKSWYFGINLCDVGIAFDRGHHAGLFTGIGLGFNNYSFRDDVTLGIDEQGTPFMEPIETASAVKKSKLGAFYAQAPLMIEIAPGRSGFFIDLGVTGGIRLDTWTKVKTKDGAKFKTHDKYGMNLFKLDASLRIGGDNLAFFANYALLPAFTCGDMEKVHPISFGVSLVF